MSEGTPPESPHLDLARLRIDRSAAAAVQTKLPFKSRWFFGAIGAVLLLMLLRWLWPAAGNSHTDSRPITESTATKAEAIVSAPTGSQLTATGYVVAQRRAAVASKGTGRLRELKVREGDLVKENDIIAVLENEDKDAELHQLQAQVASLNARVQSADAEFQDAQLQRDRMSQMRAKALVSQAEFDQTLARFRKAAADLNAAKANVALAEAQLEKGKVELDYTLIRAPFDGTVLTKNADVGEIVAPFGSSSTARAAVVTIADMSSLEVEADVSESYISRVRVGQLCTITLDSFPDKRYKGEVRKIVPTVDRAKGTVLTKIKFLEIDANVLPEMSAKVFFAE